MTFIVEIVIKIRTAATTIEGPEGVSKNNDENIPKITATTPKRAEKNAIFSGEFESCLAVAAGIINIEVINNKPTILNETATTTVISSIIRSWLIKMFTPSAFASFSLIVVNTKDCQLIDNIINTKIPPIITK